LPYLRYTKKYKKLFDHHVARSTQCSSCAAERMCIDNRGFPSCPWHSPLLVGNSGARCRYVRSMTTSPINNASKSKQNARPLKQNFRSTSSVAKQQINRSHYSGANNRIDKELTRWPWVCLVSKCSLILYSVSSSSCLAARLLFDS